MKKNYDIAYWDGAKIKDSLAHARSLGGARPRAIHMSSMDYIDLRKLGRDAMDVNIDPYSLGTGLQSRIYGMDVFVKKGIMKGVISILGQDDVPVSHVVNPRRWSVSIVPDHSLSFHPGAFPDCGDEMCLALLVMGS